MADTGTPLPTGSTREDKPDPRLLELLVCPLTKSELVYREAASELLSFKAGLAYPIRNGVPLLTADAARALTDADYEKR